MKKYVNAVLLAALGCTVLSGCGKSAAKPQETHRDSGGGNKRRI